MLHSGLGPDKLSVRDLQGTIMLEKGAKQKLQEANGFLIPVNLCSPSTVLIIVLMAELLAVCLVLFASRGQFDWTALGFTSLYIQWLVLASAGALCAIRSLLQKISQLTGIILCLLVIIGISLALSVAAEVIAAWGVLGDQQGMPRIVRNLLLCLVMAGIVLRFFYLQAELHRRQQAEMNAKIESLQARIRPHFLFNSMNSIASLVAEDPEAAERSIENLAELFRASLRENASTAPLVQELTLCRRYLEIEKLRLGDRLEVVWEVDDIPTTASIPPLTLQPLVENAVYHGIQPRLEGGTISISVACEPGVIEIKIRNPLPPDNREVAGNRMALANIRDRLAAIYADSASLNIFDQAGYFEVSLSLPLSEAA